MAHNEQGRIYRQRKRRSGKVRRFELVLNPAYGTDHQAIEYLDSLPKGTKSDFAREAILEKIAREIAPPEPATTDLDAMRAIVEDAIAAQLSGLSITMEQAQRVTISTAPEPVSVVQSSGLNMDSPRKRPKIARTEPAQITAPEPEEMTEAEIMRNTKLFVDSIKKAQPGRIERR